MLCVTSSLKYALPKKLFKELFSFQSARLCSHLDISPKFGFQRKEGGSDIHPKILEINGNQKYIQLAW